RPVVEFCGAPERRSRQASLAQGPLASSRLAGFQEMLDARDAEIAHLRELVAGYERGRFIRLMKWLHGSKR
ncbi:MAG: hypothetical protein QXP01_05730, partial [Candidatus Hadarchaeum sp.]